MTIKPSSERSFRIAALFTAINVLVASGFSIAGLISPRSILPVNAVTTQASLIFAMYAAARTIPLAAVTLVIIVKRHVSALLVLGILAGFVQAADTLIGLYQQDLGKSLGPFVLATFQFVVVRSLYNASKSESAA